MALLQISEPGQAPDPHQRRIAVGIDLGTTHSLVAAVRHGVAECLPDGEGRLILPSAVRYLEGGRRAIGHDALAAQADDAQDTIVSVKRLMGRMLADVAGHERLPYRFVDRPGMVAIETRDGLSKTPTSQLKATNSGRRAPLPRLAMSLVRKTCSSARLSSAPCPT